MKKISEETILKIKELYDLGFSNIKIAKQLGIGNNTVRKYLKERYTIIKEKHTKKINQDEFEKLWNEGKTDSEIAKYFGVAEITVKTFRTKGKNAGKFNVNRYFSQEEHTLSEIQEQMILGSLLGDMNLTKPGTNRTINSKLSIVQSEQQKELFMKKVEILGEFMGKYRLFTPKPDPRTGKIYKSWRGNSKAHKVFTNIYNLLYPNGVKTITKEYLDKINNPIALAFWFMDDGTYNGSIATNCFLLEEHTLIKEWLYTKWNLVSTIQEKSKNIYISNKSRLDFERLIFPYVLPSMYYKLKFLNILKAESV